MLTHLQGPVQHLRVLVNSMGLIVCHSLTRRAFFHRQNWEVLTQDNWVLLVALTPTYNSTSGQTHAGDLGGAGTPTERGNSRIVPLQPGFCLPNISGRKERGRPMPSNKPESSKPICASRRWRVYTSYQKLV